MEQLSRYGIIPVSFNTLEESFETYRSPKDKISRMEQHGDLIRLKRGQYVVSPQLSQQTLSRELIANHIYGPSYISLHSALSYHGLIPERVFTMQSVTVKRAKKFDTPLGTFEYYIMPISYYPIGIQQEIVDNQYSFLIASPEKALSDLIITTSGLRIQSRKAMREYLEEDLRLDIEEHPIWDNSILSSCLEHGRKKRELKFLLEVLQNG